MKKLFIYIKPYLPRFFLALVCMAGVAGLTALIRFLVKPFIDKVFIAKDMKMLYLIAIGLPVIYLFLGLLNYMKNYLMVYIAQKVILNIRNKMYEKLQSLSLYFYSKGSTGKIMSNLTNDISLLQIGITKIPVTFICDGLTLIALVIVLFYLNWKFALLSLIAFPIASIPIINFSKKMRKISLKSQEQMSNLYSCLQESITSINITKAFNQGKNEIKRFNSLNEKLYSLMMKFARTESLSSPIMEFLGAFALGLILFFTAKDVISGKWSTGSFFAFFAVAFSVYQPIKNFSQLNPIIQQALAANTRIFELLNEKQDIIESPQAYPLLEFKEKIRYENIDFCYDKQMILKNINLTIKKSEIIGIVGPSGVGKTTLMNLLLRFYDPTHGNIYIDEHNIKNVTLFSLRELIGVVTQESFFFNETIKYNIAYGKKDATEQEIINAAKLANAHDFIMGLPDKYDTVIGERGMLLSGGEKQRIAIARAIIKNPEILLLDEATSALDAESEKLVQDALEKLMKNKTVLIIAHRLSTIKKADRIVVMDNGSIVDIGTHEELFKKNGIYKKLHQLQLL